MPQRLRSSRERVLPYRPGVSRGFFLARFEKERVVKRSDRCALLAVLFFTLTLRTAGAQTLAATPAYREVVDETGRTVRVPAQVLRIVSLAPSLTETVYALGLQDRLVGDTDFCDYPPEAQTKTKVGGAINPSLEVIAHLRPDLVLVTKHLNTLDTVHSLDALGIASYATDPRTVDEVLGEPLGGLVVLRSGHLWSLVMSGVVPALFRSRVACCRGSAPDEGAVPSRTPRRTRLTTTCPGARSAAALQSITSASSTARICMSGRR